MKHERNWNYHGGGSNLDDYNEVETYDYADRAGNPRHIKIRYKLKPDIEPDDEHRPKTFRLHYLDERDGGHYDAVAGDGGVQIGLYRLPELFKASKAKQPGRVWFVCEGEKDCDAVRKLDPDAVVTTSCNTKQWPDDSSELFEGRDVIIIPDNDLAGQDYVQMVGKAVMGVAQSVKVLEVFGPDAEEGYDFSDWAEGVVHRPAEEWNNLSNLKKAERDEISEDINKARRMFRELAETALPWQPLIRLVPGPVDALAAEAEGALKCMRAPIYVFGQQLSRPITELIDGAKGRKTTVARLKPLTDVTLVTELSKFTQWERQTRNGPQRIDPPGSIVRPMLQREGSWEFDRVSGIITCPTIRQDGSIVSEPGFDPHTGLLLVEPPSLPPMPDEPTRDDAVEALKLLEGLLDQFAFVDQPFKSVGLSVLMTPVARGAMTVVPMHAVTAPAAGTGKSYMIDIGNGIFAGQTCPVISVGDSEAETEKRLSSVLITGQSFICLDNVNGSLGGDFLCQVVTQPRKQVRILGQTKVVNVESRVTVFANGNNIHVVGDLVRRTICCRMDAEVERPENRKFTNDPLAEVMNDRSKYIAAILTIVRAYIIAGRPGLHDLIPLNSFEEWTGTVRGALVWLGCADPVDTIETTRSDDPALTALSQVMEAMAGETDLKWPLTTGEMVDAAWKRETGTGGMITTEPLRPFVRPALHEALMEVAERVGRIDAKTLGHFLSRNDGRIIEKRKIVGVVDKKLKQKKWQVVGCA